MAAYISSTTTTVSSSSVSILAADASGTAGVTVEVTSLGADVWVHITGGTAAGSADNCIPIPASSGTRIDLPPGHGGLTAIRDASTDSEVTVAVLGG